MERSTTAVFLTALRLQLRQLARLLMSQRLRPVRRLALGAIGLVIILALGARLAFPLFISTDELSAAFRAEIAQASGATATVEGETVLSLWPTPVLSLSGVTLSAGANKAVTVSAKAVHVGFDVIGALFGHPHYDGLRLSQATITLRTDRPGSGAAGLLALLQPAGKAPVLSGDLVFEAARLRVGGAPDRPALTIDDIWGTVVLPGEGSAISGDLTGLLHGVATTLSFRSSDALALLTGANAPLTLALTSTPASVRFDGVGVISAQPFVSGSLSVTAPTVGGLARLLGATQLARNPLGPVSAEARLSTAGDDIKFDNVELALGDTSGRGVLDLRVPADATPILSGTIAFGRIDLSSVLPVIGGLQVERSFLGAAIEDQVSAEIRTDLRLSAEDVHFASLTASRVAAGLRGGPGRLTLDIGDATVAGGRLSGSILVAAPAGEETRGGVDIHLRDADMETLATALNLGGPVAQGRTTLSLTLMSPEPILLAPAVSLTGRLDATTGSGRITGLDPDKLTEMMQAGRCFRSPAPPAAICPST